MSSHFAASQQTGGMKVPLPNQGRKSLASMSSHSQPCMRWQPQNDVVDAFAVAHRSAEGEAASMTGEGGEEPEFRAEAGVDEVVPVPNAVPEAAGAGESEAEEASEAAAALRRAAAPQEEEPEEAGASDKESSDSEEMRAAAESNPPAAPPAARRRDNSNGDQGRSVRQRTGLRRSVRLAERPAESEASESDEASGDDPPPPLLPRDGRRGAAPDDSDSSSPSSSSSSDDDEDDDSENEEEDSNDDEDGEDEEDDEDEFSAGMCEDCGNYYDNRGNSCACEESWWTSDEEDNEDEGYARICEDYGSGHYCIC